MASWARFRPSSLLARLVAHGVDFVVVGGIALIAHGSARLTQDLDICYATDPANLDVLGAALVEVGARLRGVTDDVPFVADAATLRRTFILTLDTDDGPIDLLRAPSGSPPYPELRARAERIEIDSIAVLVASLEDMRAMKRAANRPKDKLDLEEIDAIERLRRERG